MTETVGCAWCGALVVVAIAGRHFAWHRAYDLHRPDCDHLASQIAQRGTGAYIAPRPCSCGLVTPTGQAADQ